MYISKAAKLVESGEKPRSATIARSGLTRKRSAQSQPQLFGTIRDNAAEEGEPFRRDQLGWAGKTVKGQNSLVIMARVFGPVPREASVYLHNFVVHNPTLLGLQDWPHPCTK
jgi:hypothetical protein